MVSGERRRRIRQEAAGSCHSLQVQGVEVGEVDDGRREQFQAGAGPAQEAGP